MKRQAHVDPLVDIVHRELHARLHQRESNERAARSVTVHVLPSITLAQVDKVFRAAGLPVEISFRLGKRAACVVLSSPEFLDAALSLRGAAIQPKSSASLPPCVLEIEPGVVKPPAEKVAQGASNGKKN